MWLLYQVFPTAEWERLSSCGPGWCRDTEFIWFTYAGNGALILPCLKPKAGLCDFPGVCGGTTAILLSRFTATCSNQLTRTHTPTHIHTRTQAHNLRELIFLIGFLIGYWSGARKARTLLQNICWSTAINSCPQLLSWQLDPGSDIDWVLIWYWSHWMGSLRPNVPDDQLRRKLPTDGSELKSIASKINRCCDGNWFPSWSDIDSLLISANWILIRCSFCAGQILPEDKRSNSNVTMNILLRGRPAKEQNWTQTPQEWNKIILYAAHQNRLPFIPTSSVCLPHFTCKMNARLQILETYMVSLSSHKSMPKLGDMAQTNWLLQGLTWIRLEILAHRQNCLHKIWCWFQKIVCNYPLPLACMGQLVHEIHKFKSICISHMLYSANFMMHIC